MDRQTQGIRDIIDAKTLAAVIEINEIKVSIISCLIDSVDMIVKDAMQTEGEYVPYHHCGQKTEQYDNKP